MKDRIGLREFQARLAERLQNVGSQTGEAAKLGFLAGGKHWLTSLDQVGEVVTVPRLARAPWTLPWFIGVTSVRGTIFGCTDLAVFLGAGPAETGDDIRLLLANARFGAHAAFRIRQVLGLRDVASMQRQSDAVGGASWQGAVYADADGVIWQEIIFERLLSSQAFLQVAA